MSGPQFLLGLPCILRLPTLPRTRPFSFNPHKTQQRKQKETEAQATSVKMWPRQNSSSPVGPTCALTRGSHHLLPTCSCRNITRSGCLLSKHNLHLHNPAPVLPFLFPVKSSSRLQYYVPFLASFSPGGINHSLLFTQAAGLLRHLLSVTCAKLCSALYTHSSNAACHQLCRECVTCCTS